MSAERLVGSGEEITIVDQVVDASAEDLVGQNNVEAALYGLQSLKPEELIWQVNQALPEGKTKPDNDSVTGESSQESKTTQVNTGLERRGGLSMFNFMNTSPEVIRRRKDTARLKVKSRKRDPNVMGRSTDYIPRS